MKLTWYGTATIMLDIDGEKLLFDPFFRMNKKLEKPQLCEFCEVDYIFNTHAHFDHLCDVPKILPNTKAKVYGTNMTAERLKNQKVDPDQVQVLSPNRTLKTKNASITTIPARHVVNDIPIIIKTAVWGVLRLQFKKAHIILGLHNDFRMGDEIYAFNVNAEDKNILIFGSAGFEEDATLPEKVDVLVWPFQGRFNMTKYSLPLIEKIKPSIIILDHFDNAFPPITGNVNTNKFLRAMKKHHPEIKVIVPKYKKEIIL